MSLPASMFYGKRALMDSRDHIGEENDGKVDSEISDAEDYEINDDGSDAGGNSNDSFGSYEDVDQDLNFVMGKDKSTQWYIEAPRPVVPNRGEILPFQGRNFKTSILR